MTLTLTIYQLTPSGASIVENSKVTGLARSVVMRNKVWAPSTGSEGKGIIGFVLVAHDGPLECGSSVPLNCAHVRRPVGLAQVAESDMTNLRPDRAILADAPNSEQAARQDCRRMCETSPTGS